MKPLLRQVLASTDGGTLTRRELCRQVGGAPGFVADLLRSAETAGFVTHVEPFGAWTITGAGRAHLSGDEVPLLLDKERLAVHLGVSPKTIDEWTAKGVGPPRLKFGPNRQSIVRYDPVAVREWMLQHRVDE